MGVVKAAEGQVSTVEAGTRIVVVVISGTSFVETTLVVVVMVNGMVVVTQI